MAGYSIIADVSGYMLQRMRSAVCPSLISHPEQIALTAPDQKDSTAMMGLYLYSIRDYSSFFPERRQSTVAGVGYGLPKAISLAYLVYFNRHAQTPLDPLTEQRVLGKIIQLLHTAPTIDISEIHGEADMGDEPASIAFQKLDDRQKHDLWSGFSEPMRPAIYFEAGPLLIRGDGFAVSRVTAVDGEVAQR